MSCPPFSDLLGFLAGTHPTEADEQIALHLDGCADCRSFLESQVGGQDVREYSRHNAAADADDQPALAELRQRLRQLANPADETSSSQTSEVASSSCTADLDDVLPVHDNLEQLGRFRLGRRLGVGGFGAVYLARDELLNRNVALKLPLARVIEPALRRRFLREGEAAARLHHPNIVPVHEVGEVDGVCYLACAYCPGPTIAEWLHQRSAPTPAPLAGRIVLQLAEAVQHAHENQILHRDIKPSNVILDQQSSVGEVSYTPRLTDFGLAKLLESDSSITASGTALGTPRYTAPEQASGRADQIGPATDVYGLGGPRLCMGPECQSVAAQTNRP